MAWKVSHSDTKPLSGGSAEIAAQPIEECGSGPRHAMDEAAEVLHVALAGRAEHCACAEEQQALEDRMIEHVKQRGRQRERRRQLHVVGAERQRQPKADKDDADVLDGGIGQQTLQVVLHQRGENADHRGDRPPIASTIRLVHHTGSPIRSNTMRMKP